MATLKDYESPKQFLKLNTGQSSLDSFEDVRDSASKAADRISADADKLEKVIEKVQPTTRKLQEEFAQVLRSAETAFMFGDEVLDRMRFVAKDLTQVVREFDNQIKSALQDADAIFNMYETLEKALDKAKKTGAPKDHQAAEIAGKAYEKACRNAEKSLGILRKVGKQAVEAEEDSLALQKAQHLQTIKTMYDTIDQMQRFAMANASKLGMAGRQLEAITKLGG
jgi:predicted ribosome quality control (RQC) complex YloA/Tae2 family protein